MSAQNGRRRFIAFISSLPLISVTPKNFAADTESSDCDYDPSGLTFGNWHVDSYSRKVDAFWYSAESSDTRVTPGYEYPVILSPGEDEIPRKNLLTASFLFSNKVLTSTKGWGALVIKLPRYIETRNYSYLYNYTRRGVEGYQKYDQPYQSGKKNNKIAGDIKLSILLGETKFIPNIGYSENLTEIDFDHSNLGAPNHRGLGPRFTRIFVQLDGKDIKDLLIRERSIRIDIILEGQIILSRFINTKGIHEAINSTEQMYDSMKLAAEVCKRRKKQEAKMPSCFFTSATCGAIGLDDNCWELKQLRSFRDSVMLTNEHSRNEVEEYYRMAPAIVQSINGATNSKQIYLKMYWKYILPSAIFAFLGMHQTAYNKYKSLIEWVKQI